MIKLLIPIMFIITNCLLLCNEWVEIESNISSSLKGIATIDGNSCFIIGSKGILLDYNFINSSIEKIDLNINRNFQDIFTYNNSIWITGSNGIILYSSDSGLSWIIQESGTEYNLYGISFVDENNGWVVGDGGLILKTTNGGASWDPTTISSNYIFTVHFIDNKNGFVGCYEGYLYSTNDGGASWTKVFDSPSSSSIFKIKFVDELNGWICGANNLLMKTTDGGKNWKEVKLEIDNDFLMDISFADVNSGWAVTWYGKIISTTDNGDTWQIQKELSNKLFAVEFFNSVGIAAGEFGSVFKYDNPSTIKKNKFDDLVIETIGESLIKLEVNNFSTEIISINLYDINGRAVLNFPQKVLFNGSLEINLDNYKLNSGIYFLNIKFKGYQRSLPVFITK